VLLMRYAMCASKLAPDPKGQFRLQLACFLRASRRNVLKETLLGGGLTQKSLRFYRKIIEKSMDCKLRRNPDTGAHGCESRIDRK